MKKLSIEYVVKNHLCTGCGTCISACKLKALELIQNDKGIYIPNINKNECIECSSCYFVCPGHGTDYEHFNKQLFRDIKKEPIIGHYLSCYTSYSLKKEVRFESTSGGVVTQLLIQALKDGIIDGALVTRMNKNNPLEPEPFIARTIEEIVEASKSKYCPVPANMVLEEILKSNDKIAVVGLPCHINGIRKLEEKHEDFKKRIKIHIGIFCGTTKTFQATDFLLKELGVKANNIKKFSYRGKGWPGNLNIELKNGQEITLPYKNYYDHRFCSFTPWRCSLCGDHTCELSDISFGDAWLPLYSKDKKGRSIIISRNEIGENQLKGLQNNNLIEMQKINSEDVAKSQGQYYLKKGRLASRIRLTQIYGRKIPNDNLFYPPLKTSDYVTAIWFYFWMSISSRKYLHFLFNLQPHLVRIIERD